MAVYWSKADAFKLKNKVAPQTTVKPTVVSWWPQATANALGSMQNAVSWLPSKPTSTTPVAQTTTPTPVKPTLPVFWTPASQQNATNPTYLDTRNTELAKQYGTQWLKTQEQVTAELLKNQDFATASESDRQHTADEIFKKMNVWQTTEPVQVKTDDMATDNKEYTTIQEAELDNPRTQNLSAEEKQVYGMLSDMEKKQFMNIWRADLKNGLQYLARRKEAKAETERQYKLQLKQTWLNNESSDIMSWQRIRQSEEQLNKLKANVKYLGTMGAPWVSLSKMDAINGQITEAQRVFDELKKTEANAKEFRELGYDDIASRMEREMVLMQNDLDDKVNKSIQNAFSMMTAEEITGWLDTVDEIDAFRTKLMTNLDNSIGALTDDNIKARQFLIERYDVMAKEQTTRMEEYKKNANTVNMDMSTAQWYYVDWNGSPIISMATWQPVVMPQKPPMEPIFSKETGELISFSTGANGQMVASVQKVTSGTGSGWWGKIETIYWTDERGNETKTSVMVMPDGSIRAIWGGNIWGGNTGWSPSNQPINNVNVPPVTDEANIEATVAWVQSIKDGTQWGQCGSFVNDYLERLGLWRLFVDPIEQKAGLSNTDTPTVWSVFITNSPKFEQYWHVGIVTKVNADWSFETKESNKDWELQVFSRTMQPWEAQYGFFDPRLGKQAGSAEQPWQPQQNKQEMMMQAMGLLQGTWGTEWERSKMAQNIVQTAIKNNIPLNEAKMKLWYRTQEDNEFVKNVREDYENIKKWDEATSNAKRLLSLLEQPQTPITDIASIVWFLKSIDPSSVARESETEQIRKARSIVADMGMLYEKISSGKQLTKDQRKQITDWASTIAKMWDTKLNNEIGWILTEFDERWLDATSVVRKTDIDKYAPVSYKIKNSKDKTVTPVQINAPMTQPTPTTWATPTTMPQWKSRAQGWVTTWSTRRASQQ